MEPIALLSFMKLLENLKCNTRHSWTSTGRQETVADHSWRLATLAFLIKDEFPDVNIDKVIRMCLIHDFGEAVTGDIPSFEKSGQDDITEQEAVRHMLKQLPEKLSSELYQLFDEMDALKTPEAKLYKALDKLEVVIQHNEASLSTWLPVEHTLNLTYGDEEVAFSSFLKSLREQLRNDSIDKISNEAY